MRGLKGNNPTQFAREKRIKKLTQTMDKYAEKSFHYFKIGNHKKANYYGKKVAELDTEIGSVEL